MGDITEVNYEHGKRVEKDFEIKNLYLRSNVLLLPNVFENFKNIFIKIYGLDPAKFLSAPGLVW